MPKSNRDKLLLGYGELFSICVCIEQKELIHLMTSDRLILWLGDCLSDISGWMTNIKLRLNAANLLISSLGTSLVIASHHQTLYVILVLHLIEILISENMFLSHVAPGSIIFVTFAVFVAIFLFQSPKALLPHSLLLGLITATLIFVALHLRIF